MEGDNTKKNVIVEGDTIMEAGTMGGDNIKESEPWEAEVDLLVKYGKEASESYKRFRSQVERVSSRFPQMEIELAPFIQPRDAGNVSSSQLTQFTEKSLEMIHQITQACC